MSDPNGTQATAEYYILRIYRRRPGTQGEPDALLGVVEDTKGRRQVFRNREDLWNAPVESVRRSPAPMTRVRPDPFHRPQQEDKAMSNQETVKRFLQAYQDHDYQTMQNCLAAGTRFSDYAFKEITGARVKAMWHWFCIPYGDRKEPIGVPDFEIISSSGETVIAKYRVDYFYGKKQRPVNYVIKSVFTLEGEKITRQEDSFAEISEYQFAKLAFGPPLEWLAPTPFLRMLVRKVAGGKLADFVKDKGYLV